MRYCFFIIFIIGSLACFAQSPKREFRAAWIATIANIDWPSQKGLSSTEQQSQFTQRLDKLQKLGFNAVIVQIRPCCDAYYPSELEPWSRYLTGTQGAAPSPYYDPLQFMIDETHKRNIEFHAWFNPFRALMDCKSNPNPPKHVTKLHSPWIINYGGKSYLDPGIPEARNYVIDVIMDVLSRYDIDAVHMDDYFYPYKVGKAAFGDNKSFLRYGKKQNRDDWRRNNVNTFIKDLHDRAKSAKPYVKIGISPFGVWRNSNRDPAEGSETKAGQTCYDDLYADVLLWMKKGWVDYVLPQLYWEHAHKSASFSVLLNWWNKHSFDRHVYYGLGVYHIAEKKTNFKLAELLWQLRDIRSSVPNTGYSFYSAVSIDKAGVALEDSMKQRYARFPALPPVMKWIDSIPPETPVLKKVTNAGTTQLKWTVSNTSKELLKFVVYRFEPKEALNLERSDRIISIQQSNEFELQNTNRSKHYTYVVTALDRTWNESKPSNKIVIE